LSKSIFSATVVVRSNKMSTIQIAALIAVFLYPKGKHHFLNLQH